MKTFKLDNHPKINSGFTVPDHYFETFPMKVINEIPSTETKTIGLKKTKYFQWIGLAASILLVVSLTTTWWHQSTTNTIPTENIENYLTYQSSITQYELIHELSNSDLVSLHENLTLNATELEDHLLKETDVEQLILE